ncbi:MAG TPA: hypothetical protein VNL18_02330 [Gemmatimonadales bacterium]|nr:hypothetical protein [Gemmatimonadales bacterium]
MRVVARAGYSREDGVQLLAELRRRVGDEIQVAVTLVDALERGPTGKLRFVISETPGAKVAVAPEPRVGTDRPEVTTPTRELEPPAAMR